MRKAPETISANSIPRREQRSVREAVELNIPELQIGMSIQRSILNQYPDLFGRSRVSALGAQTIAQTIPMSPEVAEYAARQQNQHVQQPVAPVPVSPEVAAYAAQQAADQSSEPKIQDTGYNWALSDPGLAHAAAELSPEQTVAAANGFGTGNREAIDPDQPEEVVLHDDWVNNMIAEAENLTRQFAERDAEPEIGPDQQALIDSSREQVADVLDQRLQTSADRAGQGYGLAG